MNSIFNQETHDNESTAFIAKKQNAVNEQVKNLALAFHSIRKDASDKEPDWNEALLQAKTGTEKMNIRAAREAWIQEQKVKEWEAQQVAFNSKVDAVLSKPVHERTKTFYENLKKENPSQYWDGRIQKQRQKDQQVLGLSFHLKG